MAPAGIPHPAGSPPSWCDLLESAVSAMRDVRTLELELVARSAVLTEALDELVQRIVDAHAAEIVADVLPDTAIDLRLERDPVTPGLLGERYR